MRERINRPGQIYVVLFSNGLAKAGMSMRGANGRISAHCRIAAIAGARKVEQIVVDVPFNTSACEKALLEYCRSVFSSYAEIGAEWFRNVSPLQFESLQPVMAAIAAQSSGLAHSCPTEAQCFAVSAFDSLVPSIATSPVSLQEVADPRYQEALYVAKLLQTMVHNEAISGPVFSRNDAVGGLSIFTVTMSVHLYAMDDEDRACCIRDVIDGLADDDLHGLFEVIADARETCTALLREHGDIDPT